VNIGGRVGEGGLGVLVELALNSTVAEAAGSAKLCKVVGCEREGGGRSADVGVVMDGIDAAGGEGSGEGLEDTDGVDDFEDGGEDGVALDATSAARDVDEVPTSKPEVLRDVVGVVGYEVLEEVGVMFLEGVDDDGAAVELVEGDGAVLGVNGECGVVSIKEELEGAGNSFNAG
jgi:hypothetical protein